MPSISSIHQAATLPAFVLERPVDRWRSTDGRWNAPGRRCCCKWLYLASHRSISSAGMGMLAMAVARGSRLRARPLLHRSRVMVHAESVSFGAPAQTSSASVTELPGRVRKYLECEQPAVEAGPVEFIRFGGDEPRKARLIFLPGIAGSGARSAAAQFPALSADFTCYRCEIRDTSQDIAAIADAIAGTIRQGLMDGPQSADGDCMPTLLMGESFGGVLALAVAVRLQDAGRPCCGIVLVNPATSYLQSSASDLEPLINAVPDAVFPGLLRTYFLGTSLDSYQSQLLLQRVLQADAPDDRDFGALQPIANLLGFVAQTLSPELDGLGLTKSDLVFRLQWLREGNIEVNDRLGSLLCPVLAVCGEADRLQPSKQEAERLERELSDCVSVVIRGGGHALLGDGRLSVANLLQQSPRFRSGILGKKPMDAIGDFRMPTLQAVAESQQSTKLFESAIAPVWLCTDATTGRLVKGLEPLAGLLSNSDARSKAQKRPVIFVGYHQRYAIDVGLMISSFYDRFGVVLRGLAHPEVMEDSAMQNVLTQFSKFVRIGLGGDSKAELEGRASQAGRSAKSEEKQTLDDLVNNQFARFGAVPVSGRNFVRLLKAGENILLFPGGVREAFHKKGEQYKLFWPDKAEFIRAAAKYDAIIVPFAGVGAAESFPLVLDQDDLNRLPGIGQNLRKANDARVRVRDDEWFSAPVGVPLPPERFYYLFGRPLDLSAVDPGDRPRCEGLYADVRADVERSLSRLQRWRRRDPFRLALPRWAWQNANKGASEVPTFPMAEEFATPPEARSASRGGSK
mmetsp:Transcript_83145/g.238893  ORF Transcript_83145/g.238893 Transcript_83145/m.238893 type:complete len:797 (-) Transcript_83145:155-2545(-)